MRFARGALPRSAWLTSAMHVSHGAQMKCAIGHCGRCQLGPHFVCRDGPVMRYDEIGHPHVQEI